MRIKEKIAAITAAALMLTLAACGTSEAANDNGTAAQADLPDIPVTDASNFTYTYSSDLGGMVITDYLAESPRVRIPDTLEGEAVVKVDFGDCDKELIQLIMPDSVCEFSLSSAIRTSLRYVNIPESVTEIGDDAFRGSKNLTNATYKGVTYDYAI